MRVIDEGSGTWRNASPADVLRWQGWETCPTCDRSGFVDRCTTNNGCECVGADPCPDCAHGLVPPDWMVEAAAEAVRHVMLFGRRDIRAALVAAARKEKP